MSQVAFPRLITSGGHFNYITLHICARTHTVPLQWFSMKGFFCFLLSQCYYCQSENGLGAVFAPRSKQRSTSVKQMGPSETHMQLSSVLLAQIYIPMEKDFFKRSAHNSEHKSCSQKDFYSAFKYNLSWTIDCYEMLCTCQNTLNNLSLFVSCYMTVFCSNALVQLGAWRI